MEDETIEVADRDTLLELLKEKEMGVDWQVFTDFGPDWIRGELLSNLVYGRLIKRRSDRLFELRFHL